MKTFNEFINEGQHFLRSIGKNDTVVGFIEPRADAIYDYIMKHFHIKITRNSKLYASYEDKFYTINATLKDKDIIAVAFGTDDFFTTKEKFATIDVRSLCTRGNARLVFNKNLDSNNIDLIITDIEAVDHDILIKTECA